MICWNLSSEIWTSTNTLSSVGHCLKHVFQGLQDLGHEGLKAAHRPLQGPQPNPRSVCQLPDTVGKAPLKSLSVWCWVPLPPKRHFYLWMDAKLLLLREKWGISYSTMRLMLLLKGMRFQSAFLWDLCSLSIFLGGNGIFFLLKFFILRISTVYNKYGKYCSQLLPFNLEYSALWLFFFYNQSIVLYAIFFFHHVCMMMYLNLWHILNICHQKDKFWKRAITRKSDSL